MNEQEIKAKFLELVRTASPPRGKPIVATEFNISGGNTRADLAVLSDEFIGIEIKSRKDSLARLVKQAYDYRAYFDRTVLVLDGKHLVKYLGIELDFCDVWTFDENERLRLFASGTHQRAESDNLYSLLTMAERENAFRNPKFEGKSKRDIFEAGFKTRYGHTSANFWKVVRRRVIKPKDIELLSRFHERRSIAKTLEQQKQVEIEKWLNAQHRFDD